MEVARAGVCVSVVVVGGQGCDFRKWAVVGESLEGGSPEEHFRCPSACHGGTGKSLLLPK